MAVTLDRAVLYLWHGFVPVPLPMVPANTPPPRRQAQRLPPPMANPSAVPLLITGKDGTVTSVSLYLNLNCFSKMSKPDVRLLLCSELAVVVHSC